MPDTPHDSIFCRESSRIAGITVKLLVHKDTKSQSLNLTVVEWRVLLDGGQALVN